MNEKTIEYLEKLSDSLGGTAETVIDATAQVLYYQWFGSLALCIFGALATAVGCIIVKRQDNEVFDNPLGALLALSGGIMFLIAFIICVTQIQCVIDPQAAAIANIVGGGIE